jgi:hypothetical protein
MSDDLFATPSGPNNSEAASPAQVRVLPLAESLVVPDAITVEPVTPGTAAAPATSVVPSPTGEPAAPPTHTAPRPRRTSRLRIAGAALIALALGVVVGVGAGYLLTTKPAENEVASLQGRLDDGSKARDALQTQLGATSAQEASCRQAANAATVVDDDYQAFFAAFERVFKASTQTQFYAQLNRVAAQRNVLAREQGRADALVDACRNSGQVKGA